MRDGEGNSQTFQGDASAKLLALGSLIRGWQKKKGGGTWVEVESRGEEKSASSRGGI